MTRNELAVGGWDERLEINRLRIAALNRLGVKPRDRVKLGEILDLGIAALDRNAAPTTVGSTVNTRGDNGSETAAPVMRGEHKVFADLLMALAAECHVYLVGPAGSGKTTAAEHAAQHLKLDFYCQSVGPQTTQSQLLGYMDANGNYVSTVFRRAFEHGGVYLLDEIDAGNANVLTCLNAALANDYCSFPDGMIRRHANFRCVAGANTFGTGADRQYVGRNQLDAASIDRFVFLEMGYDETIEASMSTDAVWTAYVQKVRRAVSQLKLRHVVSPRASKFGSKLLAKGASKAKAADMSIWKGLDAVSRAKVEAIVGTFR